jgi:LytS/YehU family sensor histidine kinase
VNSYIGRLSKVIRALIDRTSQNDVDLRSELDWIRDYVALESVGRQLKIEFSVSIDEELDPEEIFLPAFILQPVVENAMFHGALNEDPVIRCDVRLVDNHLRIFIRNRIANPPAQMSKNGSNSRGLQFMTERLKGWGRYHGFDLENKDVLSTRFTETEWSTEIIVPFINHELPLVNRK